MSDEPAHRNGPEEAEDVLSAICKELPVPVPVRDLVKAARRAAISFRPLTPETRGGAPSGQDENYTQCTRR